MQLTPQFAQKQTEAQRGLSYWSENIQLVSITAGSRNYIWSFLLNKLAFHQDICPSNVSPMNNSSDLLLSSISKSYISLKFQGFGYIFKLHKISDKARCTWFEPLYKIAFPLLSLSKGCLPDPMSNLYHLRLCSNTRSSTSLSHLQGLFPPLFYLWDVFLGCGALNFNQSLCLEESLPLMSVTLSALRTLSPRTSHSQVKLIHHTKICTGNFYGALGNLQAPHSLLESPCQHPKFLCPKWGQTLSDRPFELQISSSVQ